MTSPITANNPDPWKRAVSLNLATSRQVRGAVAAFAARSLLAQTNAETTEAIIKLAHELPSSLYVSEAATAMVDVFNEAFPEPEGVPNAVETRAREIQDLFDELRQAADTQLIASKSLRYDRRLRNLLVASATDLVFSMNDFATAGRMASEDVAGVGLKAKSRFSRAITGIALSELDHLVELSSFDAKHSHNSYDPSSLGLWLVGPDGPAARMKLIFDALNTASAAHGSADIDMSGAGNLMLSASKTANVANAAQGLSDQLLSDKPWSTSGRAQSITSELGAIQTLILVKAPDLLAAQVASQGLSLSA